MKQCYTENNLIRLIYQDCDIFERLELENAIQEDLCMRKSYDDIVRVYRTLPKVTFAPKSSTISNILHYCSDQLQATC